MVVVVIAVVAVVVVVGRLVAIRVALDQLLDDVFPCPVVRPQRRRMVRCEWPGTCLLYTSDAADE